jgi:acetyltransferase-like isoleucine patch superfamily enzyme
MKIGFILSLISLLLSSALLILVVISRLFYNIPWIQVDYDFIVPGLALVFYDYNTYVYASIIITFSILMPTFVIGYNLTKSSPLTGSILYIFSILGFSIVILFSSLYTYISIFFAREFSLNARFMFALLFLPLNFAFMLVFFLINIDFYVFFKDLVKARKVWMKKKPNYEIVEKGKMTYINIETDEHIFTPIPMLIIANYLRSKKFSVAWFVKGAFNHLFSLITTYLIGWPRARNKLFRFIGMKIGDNCHISQNSLPDPLLPELIEFEDGSGCGIGTKFLTHNAMHIKHGSFSFGPIKVCKNARIGAYSLILPGVTIGEGSIVGARSVVSEDIPPFSIAFGSPAKVVRRLTEKEKQEVDKDFSFKHI